MLRTYGKGAAGLTLLGDFLKTAIAILIGGFLGGFGYLGGISIGGVGGGTFPLTYIAGLFSVLGHIYPVYYKFKGGKGVLCTAVIALILNPIEFLILIAGFILIVYISKYVSLGSVTVATLYPLTVYGHIRILYSRFENPTSLPATGIISLVTIILAVMIVVLHKENLKRISNGTERKFSIGGKKKSSDSEDKN
jgi:glycerol-3-phosphate acyltransferase PlsY